MAKNHMSTTPESNEDRITAAVDGEITPEIERLMAENDDFAAQVRGIRQFESKLKSALFRWDCPTPQQLGDYQLQLISPITAAEIKTHLAHCVHCQTELEELTAFLAQGQEIVPKPKTKKQQWRGARLGDIIAQLMPQVPQLSAAGLRGDSRGPQMLQANGITIFIETEKRLDHFLIKSQLAADTLDEWYSALVQVYQETNLVAVTTVDEEGAFQFQLDDSAPINIRIENSSGKAVAIQDFSLE